MEFCEYQSKILKISGRSTVDSDLVRKSHDIMYCALGIGGEGGEVLEEFKKALRTSSIDDLYANMSFDKKQDIAYELGDLLYFIARMAVLIDYSFDDIAGMNLDKITIRQNAKDKPSGTGMKPEIEKRALDKLLNAGCSQESAKSLLQEIANLCK